MLIGVLGKERAEVEKAGREVFFNGMHIEL